MLDLAVDGQKQQGSIVIELLNGTSTGSRRFSDLCKGVEGVGYRRSKIDALFPVRLHSRCRHWRLQSVASSGARRSALQALKRVLAIWDLRWVSGLPVHSLPQTCSAACSAVIHRRGRLQGKYIASPGVARLSYGEGASPIAGGDATAALVRELDASSLRHDAAGLVSLEVNPMVDMYARRPH